MRILSLVVSILFISIANAADKISVSIDDLNNVSGNGALEACGKALHVDGKKPLLVTLTHDQSNYTTLTDENGKWCIVFKRWTFNGEANAIATTMDFTEKSSQTFIMNLQK